MGKGGKRKGGPVFILALLIFSFGLGALTMFFLEGYFKKPKPPSPEKMVLKEAAPFKKPAIRVAIVIDDMGGDLKKLRSLLAFDKRITVAVLPRLRFSKAAAVEAHRMGAEVLLHLPMEPENRINNPGGGALLTGMSVEEIKKMVASDISAVPYIDGVNNHMGSRFTENEALMRTVLGVLKENGFFFLDSRTSPHSVARRVAEELGVRYASRDVFLDNKRDRIYIRGQFKELLRIARKRGRAIAIGHPYPETIEVLKEVVSEEFGKNGFELVRLSELVKGG